MDNIEKGKKCVIFKADFEKPYCCSSWNFMLCWLDKGRLGVSGVGHNDMFILIFLHFNHWEAEC